MRTLLVLSLVAAIAVAGCGGRDGSRAVERTPVVVDTDMGPDDALALLFLVARRDVDVRAVAVSGTGLARCPAGAEHALKLLAAAGRPEIPVACGRDQPLAGFNAFPPEWRDPADAFFGVPLPPVGARPDPRGAVELLHDAITSAPRDAELVALGPLTDVAALLRRYPSVTERLAGIHAMAGTVDAPGNIGPGHEGAEYNVWVDPVAADEVLRSDVPTTLVPLDATNAVPATVFFAIGLQRFHYRTPAASLAWELVDITRMHAGGRYFWDPLAAAALVTPAVTRLETERLRATRDGRLVRDGSRRAVRVAVSADRGRFERELLGTLAGGIAGRDPRREDRGGDHVRAGRLRLSWPDGRHGGRRGCVRHRQPHGHRDEARPRTAERRPRRRRPAPDSPVATGRSSRRSGSARSRPGRRRREAR